LIRPNGAPSPSGEASVPSFFFRIFLFRRVRFRCAPDLRAFHECPIKTQSEEHATDPLSLRQLVPPEVWWVAEDLPAATFCGQVYAPSGRLLPFRGLSSQRAFRNACEASSGERRLRVATFFQHRSPMTVAETAAIAAAIASQGLVDVVISNKYLHAGFPFPNRAFQTSAGDAPLGLQCACLR
jgi:hypothetical protein